MTLNDLERRNRPNGCVISRNSVAFWADCVKVVEDTRILSAAEMYANNVVGLLTVFKPKPKPRFLARTEENRNPNFSWA